MSPSPSAPPAARRAGSGRRRTSVAPSGQASAIAPAAPNNRPCTCCTATWYRPGAADDLPGVISYVIAREIATAAPPVRSPHRRRRSRPDRSRAPTNGLATSVDMAGELQHRSAAGGPVAVQQQFVSDVGRELHRSDHADGHRVLHESSTLQSAAGAQPNCYMTGRALPVVLVTC